jgi:hypothetical protein
MSCIASPEFLLLSLLGLLIPIAVFQFFVSKKFSYVMSALIIEISIILNQGELGAFFPFAYSIYFSILVITIVPLILFLLFKFFDQDGKEGKV